MSVSPLVGDFAHHEIIQMKYHSGLELIDVGFIFFWICLCSNFNRHVNLRGSIFRKHAPEFF